jgi:hypothetical protein
MKHEASAPWMQKNSPELDSSKITQAIARQVQNEYDIKTTLKKLERNHHVTNDSLGSHEPQIFDYVQESIYGNKINSAS